MFADAGEGGDDVTFGYPLSPSLFPSLRVWKWLCVRRDGRRGYRF